MSNGFCQNNRYRSLCSITYSETPHMISVAGGAVQWEVEYSYPWWSIIFARSHAAVRPPVLLVIVTSLWLLWYRKRASRRPLSSSFYLDPITVIISIPGATAVLRSVGCSLLHSNAVRVQINFHCAKEVLHRNKNKSSSGRCQGRRAFHIFPLIRVNGIVIASPLFEEHGQANEF